MIRLLLICTLLWPLSNIAQDTLQYRPYFTLKTSPKRLLAAYRANVALLGDIPLGNKFALELCGGYIFDSRVWASPAYGETFTGSLYRAAFKYYWDQRETRNTYISLYFHNDFIVHEDKVLVFRYGKQYREWIDQTRQWDLWGLGVVLGRQIRTKRLMYEPYIGLGFRRNNLSLSPLPSDAEPAPENQRRGGFTPEYNTADFILGINMGYIFTRPLIQKVR